MPLNSPANIKRSTSATLLVLRAVAKTTWKRCATAIRTWKTVAHYCSILRLSTHQPKRGINGYLNVVRPCHNPGLRKVLPALPQTEAHTSLNSDSSMLTHWSRLIQNRCALKNGLTVH